MRTIRPIGILGGLLLFYDAVRWLLEWPLVRRVLEIANLGQLVDFILDHWQHPGWLGNPLVQLALMVVGLGLIYLDVKRPLTFKVSNRQMITGGLLVILIGVVIVAVGIWHKQPKPASAPGTPELTEEQKYQITAPLRDQINKLTASNTEKDRQLATKDRELSDARGRPAAPPIGPRTTMSIIGSLSSPPVMEIRSPNPKGTKWMLIFSPTERETQSLITSLLSSAGLDVQWFPAADRNVYPEAPDLQASDDAGITLHGNSALSLRLLEVLQMHRCVNVHHREKTPETLQHWYGHAAHDEREVIWIEIGPGPVWTMDKRCII